MKDFDLSDHIILHFECAGLSHWYGREESRAFLGRCFAANNKGIAIGRVVDTFAYYFKINGNIQYGLIVQFKNDNCETPWKGSLGHHGSKQSSRVVFLDGNLEARVDAELRSAEKPSKELLRDVKKAIQIAQRTK